MTTIRHAPEGEEDSSGRRIETLLEVEALCAISIKRYDLLCALPSQNASIPEKGSLSDFVTEVHRDIYEFTLRLGRLLRWRAGSMSNADGCIHYGPFEWSEDGHVWHQIERGTRGRMRLLLLTDLTDEVSDSVATLLEQEVDAPFAYELFYEAGELAMRNPRSALLLLAASMEIGVKHTIAVLAPDAEWLAFNVPAPDPLQLLTEYLPRLTDKAAFLARSPRDASIQEWLDQLRALTRARNALAHRGEVILSVDSARGEIQRRDGTLEDP